MATKKTSFNRSGLKKLPNDKPVLYRIETGGGKLNYAGIAKKGRVQARLNEHLGQIPGAKVSIEQFSSISEARSRETNVVRRNRPKYNDQT